MNVSTMDQWERKPYDIIFNTLAGCTEQCPFCKEQCDLTNDGHARTNEGGTLVTKHSVAMHRPECLGGYRWVSSGEMSLDICTSLVGSDGSFKNRDTNNEFREYKKYQELYPTWVIPDDKSIEASSYWKWLVAHYTKEVAKLFAMKEAEIFQEWKDLTWADVRKDLESMH